MKNPGGRPVTTNTPEHIERIRCMVEDQQKSFKQIAQELGLSRGSVWWTYYYCVPVKRMLPIIQGPVFCDRRPTMPFVPGLTHSASYKLDNPANVWQYEWRL